MGQNRDGNRLHALDVKQKAEDWSITEEQALQLSDFYGDCIEKCNLSNPLDQSRLQEYISVCVMKEKQRRAVDDYENSRRDITLRYRSLTKESPKEEREQIIEEYRAFFSDNAGYDSKGIKVFKDLHDIAESILRSLSLDRGSRSKLQKDTETNIARLFKRVDTDMQTDRVRRELKYTGLDYLLDVQARVFDRGTPKVSKVLTNNKAPKSTILQSMLEEPDILEDVLDDTAEE